MKDIKIIPTTGRNNCGSKCILKYHVQNNKIIKVTTDEIHEDGTIPMIACVKGMNYHTTYISDERLKYPMKRIGKRGEGKFERMSWEQAIDFILKENNRIRDTYGPASRYVNYGDGQSCVCDGKGFVQRFLALDGGYLNYHNNYSNACVKTITPYIYGTVEVGNNPSDWLHSKLIILWGHNPLETKFDADTMYYLRKCKDKGIPIIGIDPRKNKTIQYFQADWYPIKPGSDAALGDAIAYELYTNNLYDKDFVDRCCQGFTKKSMPKDIDPSECYFSYLMGEKDGIKKDCEWASQITGLEAHRIQELAHRIGNTHPINIIQGYGPQRNAYGEQAARAGIMLACLTGSVGVSGGSPAGPNRWNLHYQPSLDKGINPIKASIPCFLWTDAIVRAKEMTIQDGLKGCDHLDSNIKMIYNIAGNTLINQHCDIHATQKILEDESLVECIVVSDVFMTPSAKYADILLPCTSFLEEENITIPWGSSNFIGFNNMVIPPLYECKPEFEWIKVMAKKNGIYEEFCQGKETIDAWLRSIFAKVQEMEPELIDYDLFKKEGIYRYKKNEIKICFEKECKDPIQYPFQTPSGKIEIFSTEIYNMKFSQPFPAIPRFMEYRETTYPLQLVGWHTNARCHTIGDNNPILAKLDKKAIYVHPIDAKKRNLSQHETVLVYNDVGVMKIPVYITEDIMPGVCGLSQGRWYKEENGVEIGGNINIFTKMKPTPLAKGNPQHTNFVEIKKI